MGLDVTRNVDGHCLGTFGSRLGLGLNYSNDNKSTPLVLDLALVQHPPSRGNMSAWSCSASDCGSRTLFYHGDCPSCRGHYCGRHLEDAANHACVGSTDRGRKMELNEQNVSTSGRHPIFIHRSKTCSHRSTSNPSPLTPERSAPASTALPQTSARPSRRLGPTSTSLSPSPTESSGSSGSARITFPLCRTRLPV